MIAATRVKVDFKGLRATVAGRPVRDPARRLRVLVVDDQDLALWGLRTLFIAESWVECCLTADNPGQALEVTRRYEPHVALVEMLLGTESGTNLCAKLREISPMTHVLLTSATGRITGHSAQELGASGFVPKGWRVQDIASATRMVGLGMSVFAPEPKRMRHVLSERELDVLQLIARGSTNREIADALFLSPHTIKDHASAIYRKMKAKNRADAIQRAQRLGLLV
ncbi:MAG TPA: response regulator transcription factor [Thermoleophilaceae bacterium]|jgi:two-component system response regulator DesR